MEVLSRPRIIERLVREKRTGLYFKSPCEWTDNREEARHFDDLVSVFEACSECDLAGVELVLKHLSDDSEIQLDLTPGE